MPESFPSFVGFDKILHLAAYYLLGYMIHRVNILSKNSFIFRHASLLTVIIGTLYGISDEWHQSFVPGRDASIYDLIFDALGIIMAVVTFRQLKKVLFPLSIIENRIEEALKCEKRTDYYN